MEKNTPMNKTNKKSEIERERETMQRETLLELWIQLCLKTTLNFQLFESIYFLLVSHSEFGFLPLAYQGNSVQSAHLYTTTGSFIGLSRGNFLHENSESTTYVYSLSFSI